MIILTKIGRGKLQHAAEYVEETGEIILFCDSLKYPSYCAVIRDTIQPTPESVDCKKCLKNIAEWHKGE